MTNGELINLLIQRAKEYRSDANSSLARNDHQHPVFHMDQSVIDALLTDFINYVGANQGMDVGLCSYDLEK